jgi:sortase A
MFKKSLTLIGLILIAMGLIYFAKASAMPIKALIGDLRLNYVWEEALKTGKPKPPWSGADFLPIGQIKIPKLGISRIVLNSASGEAMTWGIGKVSSSSEVEVTTTSVLAGHRDSHMRFLSKLQIGDQVEYQLINGIKKTYVIREIKIVRNASYLLPITEKNNDILVLTTCWPFNAVVSGPERFILTAEYNLA